MKRWVAAAGITSSLLLPVALPSSAAAQDALIVECSEGTVMLENSFVPQNAVGPQGEKVLPMHMLLTRPGTFTFEFRSDQPFTLYAYRYDLNRRDWEFLPASNVSQPGSDAANVGYNGWQTTVTKTAASPEDYLFQAQPATGAQGVPHRFVHIRRTASCPPG
jgi:hypothetical protein